jgi:hypothetical protein
VLLQLENSGVLDVTRERNPPHYHVAVFPLAYAAYAGKRAATEAARAADAPRFEAPAAPVHVAKTAQSLAVRSPSGPPVLLLVVTVLGALAFTTLLTRRYAMR